jgi:phage antirepressor YoqD-like protein
MGYSGIKASEFKEMFIDAFNKMESLLKNDDYIMARAHEISVRNIKALEEQLQKKDQQLELARETIKESAPKVEYYDEVLQTKDGITTTIIAKDLGMSAIALNRLLHKHGVIYQSQKTWVLYEKYVNRGYTVTKTFTHSNSDGIVISDIQTYWTEAGRKFIMDGVKKVRSENKFQS